MAEPQVNNFQRENTLVLDKVTILSNEESMPIPAKVVPITAPAGPPKQPTERRQRSKKNAPSFLQEEEIERLFRAIGNVRDRAIFRLAYHAGLRASEVGMLELRDYQARTDRLYVHRLKGSNSGEHHLCREESRALRAWLKLRGLAPGVMFHSRKGGPISRKMLDVLMKQYGEGASIPEKLRHFHVLKHSCATHLLSKGFHLEQVQDWIGHANIQNTMIYARVTNARREQMGQTLRDTWK
jgi:integrase